MNLISTFSFKWLVSVEASRIYLLATLIFIFWYALETWKLRKASQKQVELIIRPLVIIYYENMKLWIQNVGNGLALNVAPGDTSWYLQEGMGLEFKFQNINFLNKEEKQELRFKTFLLGNELSDESWIAHFDQEYSKHDYKAKIYYENIDGIRYCSEVNLGKSGVFIEKNYKV